MLDPLYKKVLMSLVPFIIEIQRKEVKAKYYLKSSLYVW